MVFCPCDGFLGHIHAFDSAPDPVQGLEFVYYHYYWEPGFNEDTFGEIFYDTHCITPGKASPVFLVCPD